MPYDESYDPNVLDQGLPDNFTATFDVNGFRYDESYNNGQDLFMDVGLVDIDDPDIDDPQKLWVKVGKGWEPSEDGASVVRIDGKSKNFHANSYMGLMIASLVEAEVDVRDICKQKDAMPTEAAFWQGIRAHFNLKEINYGGDIGKMNRLLITEVVDINADSQTAQPAPKKDEVKQEAKPAAKGTAKKTTTKTAPADNATVSVSGVELSQDDYKVIYDLAYDAEGPEDFQAQALGKFEDNDSAMIAILDTTTGSIWDTAANAWNEANG